MEKRLWRNEAGEYENFLEHVDFEVLPTEKAVSLVDKIPEVSGIRVTCRPSGYREGLNFFEKLSEENKKRTVLHLGAARVNGREDMDLLASEVERLGVKRVFLVRGDGVLGDFSIPDTETLLESFYDRGVRFEKVDVAGHPEGNPYDSNDVETLLRKQEIAGLLGLEMEIVTQMCFDSEQYVRWLEKIRGAGVELPVRVGVLGKVKIETLINAVGALGISDVASFIKNKPSLAIRMAEFAVFGYSPKYFIKEMEELGAEKRGVVGYSVFTLGNISKSVEEFGSIKEW